MYFFTLFFTTRSPQFLVWFYVCEFPSSALPAAVIPFPSILWFHSFLGCGRNFSGYKKEVKIASHSRSVVHYLALFPLVLLSRGQSLKSTF